MIGIKRRQTPYCRVSTDDIDQVISIELQKDEYQKKIRANPNWEYMGTYVDDGFSGTNTEHRPGFRLMMQAAMEGRLDVIITKSVSRFARNLLDCIGWVAIFIWHTCTITSAPSETRTPNPCLIAWIMFKSPGARFVLCATSLPIITALWILSIFL